MGYTIKKSDDVWIVSVDDRPGALAEVLRVLADAGVDLEFVLARRSPDHPGKAVVFAAPIKGAKQMAAAQSIGMHKSTHMKTLRLDGPNKPGVVAVVTAALGEAGINLRGVSAVAVGNKCVVNIAVDTPDDATKAVRVIKKTLKIG